jgi:hypothetical protein
MYDIFFVGQSEDRWTSLKLRYPNARHCYELSIKEIQEKSFTKLFWVIWDDVVLDEVFNINEYKATKWDDHYTHIFKNGECYDGICLINKTIKISTREFDNRFFANKKNIDIQASKPVKYDVFYINTYEEYLEAVDKSSTSMFWAVWKDVNADSFKFDYQVPKYEQHITHIFKNGKHYDGVCLFSKKSIMSCREVEYRFFVVKKEINILASQPIPFDIVFISYFEEFAEENFQKLLNKVGDRNVYRVNGVKGIHQAHIEAAKLVSTNMFWVVDADAEIVDSFKFDYQVASYNQDTVHVWRSKNPLNDLEYGYGGVKLFPTKLTLEMRTDKPDMTTSISSKFNAVPELSNLTVFNTDPFNSWKSAFRECCKLSSRIIDRQQDEETQHRLDAWCNNTTDDYALDGARAGRDYGLKNKDNVEALKMINDFTWLKEQFDERCRKD